MRALPLLVFDTNILMDVLLGRDGASAALLVDLAEKKLVELVIPEYVLFEFRGTALRWIRDEVERVKLVRRAVNDWGRCQELDTPAQDMKNAAADLERKLEGIRGQVDDVIQRVKSAASVPRHTHELHFQGDLRYLAGRPPDRPVDGLKDCRIYEAVLAIARDDQPTKRPKHLVTRDSDFDMKELVDELAGLGFTISKEPGRLYGAYRG